MSQLVGTPIQFAIGERLILEYHGNVVRCLCDLGLKQVMETLVARLVGRGGIEGPQHLMTFILAQVWRSPMAASGRHAA